MFFLLAYLFVRRLLRQPRDRREAHERPLPDPRPGREVLRAVRRDPPLRGREDRQDPDPVTPNTVAERFIRTARAECLDWLLVLNRRHLERVLHRYLEHYNSERPHRALELAAPAGSAPPRASPAGTNDVRRRDLFAGLIHEYYAAA